MRITYDQFIATNCGLTLTYLVALIKNDVFDQVDPLPFDHEKLLEVISRRQQTAAEAKRRALSGHSAAAAGSRCVSMHRNMYGHLVGACYFVATA